MAIQLLGNPQSRNVQPEAKDIATVITANTIAAYDATSGLIKPATSASVKNEVVGVFTESIAASVSTQANVELKMLGAEYVVTATNNSDVAHNGNKMLLTNASAVNNTSTDQAAGVVVQTGVFGAPSDKLIKVQFVA